LTPSNILAATNGKEEISKLEVEEINAMFFDAKASAKLLQAQASKYISWETYS